MNSVFVNFIFVCGLAICLPFLQGKEIISLRPEVTLSTGPVRGWRLPSKAKQGTYLYAFKGIPYAKPPRDKLRFKAPLPADNWTTLIHLSQNDPMPCAQNLNQIFGPSSEDCLFVNVYTPEGVNSSSLLPVMVWIHGGAYFGGSSDSSIYGGDYLVEQGIVFVTMNYRLGALGFLNLGTDAVPGNAGLKDQHLALKWVQNEITKFGGDPKKVTLFGQSAGSASAVLHYISPRSSGLFRGVIAESGNALAEWTFLETGFDVRARALSGKLNCTGTDNTVNLTCLQNANVQDVIMYQDLPVTPNEYIPGNTFLFGPTLEKTSETAILSDTPENLLSELIKSGGDKLPLIMGVNRDEGLGEIQSDPNYYQQLVSNLKYFIPKPIRDKKTETQIEADAASIYTEYFNDTLPSLSNLDGYIKIYSDKMFTLSPAVFARKIANLGTTYLYHFDFDGKFKQQHTSAMRMNFTKGVNHGDEMGYIFVRGDLNQSTTPENETEMIILRKMVAMWTNFAKYGNPTPGGTNDTVLSNFTWTPIKEGSYRYMRVTDQFVMSEDNFQEETVVFWSKIESTGSYGSRTSYTLRLLVFFVFGNLISLYI